MVEYVLKTLRNWKVLLMSLLVNMVTISLTALLLPGIVLTRMPLSTFILLAVAMGLLNTLVKPIFQLLTIRLVFIMYGVNLIIINAIILLLLDWIFGSALEITGLLTILLGAVVIGVVSTFLDYLFGVFPPLGYMQALREEVEKS